MRQNPHVRICGGPGSATTLVYPTPKRWHRNGGQVTAADEISTNIRPSHRSDVISS